MKPFLRTTLGIVSFVTAATAMTPMARADTIYQQSDQTNGAIRVNVDGAPIAFTGVQPIESQGSVLVPLRGVFEAMGAFVDYNEATRTIYAEKGSRKVSLPLGATTATVNGESQSLNQPAQVIRGTTLVPLRFIAEALGSNVEWVGSRNLVRIQTAGTPIASMPQPVDDRTTGVVRSVSEMTDPRQITLRIDGEDRVIPLSGSASIWRRVPGQAPVHISFAQIVPGDRVVLHEDENGVATRITATYAVRQGTVSSVGALADGNAIIVLQNGDTVELAPRVLVNKDGERVAVSEIIPYDHVTVHTDPTSNLGYSVVIGQNLRAHRRN